jgi:hypothetical protein
MPELRVRTIAAAALAGLALAGIAAAAPLESLPPGWSHAEINVTVNGRSHTIILDRGRVQSTSSSTIVLRERDGSIVSVPVSPATKVRVNGQPASLSAIQPGFTATTRRVDGGAARLVQAFDPARRR